MKMAMSKKEKKRARRTTAGPASSPLQEGDGPKRKADSRPPLPPPEEAKARTKDGKRQTGDEGPYSIDFFQINNGITSPRLLIGTPAYNWADAGNPDPGYVGVATYQDLLTQVKAKDLPNLAGAMFWDGGYQSTSAQVVDGESVTYADVVRDVLGAP